jgi:hypothetical protein
MDGAQKLSLRESLIVIAITVVLMAIFVPVVRLMRERTAREKSGTPEVSPVTRETR